MPQRIGPLVFALAVGLLAAFMSYRWILDAGPRAERASQARAERAFEERVVLTSRALLESTLAIGELELVDPLAPDRVVGKAYVYPAGQGWEVSGFYRRGARDLWHPYLVTLDATLQLAHLKISDTTLLGRNGEGALEVLP